MSQQDMNSNVQNVDNDIFKLIVAEFRDYMTK